MSVPPTVFVAKSLLTHPRDRERLDLLIEIAFGVACERGVPVAVEEKEGRLRLGEPQIGPYVRFLLPGNAQRPRESLIA